MRRFISRLFIVMLLIGSFSLAGCVMVPARGGHVRVWVPGFWTPTHVWVGAHWRYR